MAKKNNGDKSLEMSKEYFDGLTLLSLENIGDFFGFDGIFFVIDLDAKRKSFKVIRSFLIDRQMFKNSPYTYKWYWGDEVKECVFKISKDESDSDYNNRINSYKKLLRDEIKCNRAYGRRV